MIIITGPGRSGTSLIAQAYRAIGLDPGGSWDSSVRAGLEDPRVYDVNRRILKELGVTTLGLRRAAPHIDQVPISAAGRRVLKRLIGPSMRRNVREAFENNWLNRSRTVDLVDWALVAPTAAKFREEIAEVANGVEVRKDPQFCWTLPIWRAAGAKLDHVIVMTRPVDQMVASRTAANHLKFAHESDARNALIYALGNVMSCLADGAIAHTLFRFSDVLDDPRRVGERLPLPDESRRSEIVEAVARTVDRTVSRFSS